MMESHKDTKRKNSSDSKIKKIKKESMTISHNPNAKNTKAEWSYEKSSVSRAAKQHRAMMKKPETEKEKKERLAKNRQQFVNRLITKPKKKFKYVYYKKLCKDGVVRTVSKKVPVKKTITKIKRIDW